MSNSIVSNVYRHVIDDVINQVRGDFEEMGIDDNILNELQRSWETKVARSRVANFMVNEEGYYDQEASQAGLSADGNQLQYPPVTIHESLSTSAAAASLATMASGSASARRDISESDNQNRGSGYVNPNSFTGMMQPGNMANGEFAMPNISMSSPSLSLNQNSQLPNNGRSNIPQQDGANDELTTEDIDSHIAGSILEKHTQDSSDDTNVLDITAFNHTGKLIPVDELPEEYQNIVREAKERAIAAGALSPSYRIPQLDGDDDEPDEDEINSELDDSDDDDDDAEGTEDLEHIILCLYDKVTRTKNKWKCVLKDGIMLVNGRDYLFHRANGDFEW
ncbi:transcription factor IIA subunit alpha [Umbelopsis sp. WA50703]